MLKDYSYLYPNKADTVIQVFTVQSEDDYKFWENLKTSDKSLYEQEKSRIAEDLKKGR